MNSPRQVRKISEQSKRGCWDLFLFPQKPSMFWLKPALEVSYKSCSLLPRDSLRGFTESWGLWVDFVGISAEYQ